MDGAEGSFRLSKYAQIVHFGDVTVISHGPRLQRLCLTSVLGRSVADLLQRDVTARSFTRTLGIGARGGALFDELLDRGFLVPLDEPEDEKLHAELSGALGHSSFVDEGESYNSPVVVDVTSYATTELRPFHVQLIGGCVLDFLKSQLEESGRRQGYSIRTSLDFPESPESVARALAEASADVTVLMLGTRVLLSPLFDYGHGVSPAERQKRVEVLKARISSFLEALDQTSNLVIVHNIAPAQASPFGRLDFRAELGFRAIARELNDHIADELRPRQNCLLLDEEALAYRYGESTLFDDRWFPFSHHGGAPDPAVEHPNQLPLISRALSDEYLSLHRLWTGTGRVKCVVCDLDGTLWPDVAADVGFAWTDSDDTSAWLYRGIHQALSVLRGRGVLLATCSKNDLEPTLAEWEAAAGDGLLRPDDFVVHKIDWRPKSSNIRELTDQLGLAIGDILYIDDNPVELAEVQQALPGIRVLRADPTTLRARLLDDPTLETPAVTDEASRRSDMVKAQLRRDAESARAPDQRAFLIDLGIQLRLTRLNPTSPEVDRVVELVQRTNQFNTSLKRYSRSEVVELASAGKSAVYCMRTRDRFSDYGLVGVCICVGDTIDSFVMSCRVIGLSAALPFLGSVVRRRWDHGTRLSAVVVDGPRNQPCRTLYSDAGFAAVGHGRHELRDWELLASTDEAVHDVSWENELELVVDLER